MLDLPISKMSSTQCIYACGIYHRLLQIVILPSNHCRMNIKWQVHINSLMVEPYKVWLNVKPPSGPDCNTLVHSYTYTKVIRRLNVKPLSGLGCNT